MSACPKCQNTRVDTIDWLPDGRSRHACDDCHHVWTQAPAEPVASVSSVSARIARRGFPTALMVDEERAQRVAAAKAEFLRREPVEEPEVAPYCERYQQVFSKKGLPRCDPQDLKDFGNNAIGANPGNMSEFNAAWNADPAGGAERVREAIGYLLYGPKAVPVEDRLTDLIDPKGNVGMTGFREALLMRVLCVVRPAEYLPILIYSGPANATGKREIAERVYGLALPRANQSTMRIGRVAKWSNDLLLELLGDGFATQQHASQFLWEARGDQRGGKQALSAQ